MPEPQTPRVLIVDDDAVIRGALQQALAEAGYLAESVPGTKAASEILSRVQFDAVLLDVRLKDGDGMTLLEQLRRERHQLPVIIATAYGDSTRTISAMKTGAFDYLTKPFDIDRLLATLARAVRVPAKARVAESSLAAGEIGFVGSSPAILEVWKTIGRAAASDATVLITGETGVGKELVARAIHENGAQRGGPFVAVNIAALAPSLVESELFGHEKGSFTGAAARHVGRFELAAGGTLLLDEIGDLDPALQTKLLRVLEERSFERVGGGARVEVGARIIAATSKPALPGSAGAALREDLYYRLGVVRIQVPPLRERSQDIPLLVDAFLRGGRRPRRAISEAALERLLAFHWPGNVRQLKHVLEQACVMSSSDVLDLDDLALPDQAAIPTRAHGAPGDQPSLNLRENLEALERRLISQALESANGNRALAARLLGIRRAQLYARMKHLEMPQLQ